MRSHRLRTALAAGALAAGTAACGAPGETPPPAPANDEDVDPVAPPSPVPDVEPPEDAIDQ